MVQVLLIICAVSAFTWLIIILMPARWKMSECWEPSNDLIKISSELPSLTVIVPARNESKTLPLTLPSWLNQDYQKTEIIIVNDNSSDNTAECAKAIASNSNKNVQIINGTEPPSGWSGKLWALQQGINVSSGEWLLFTDADILHNQNVWSGLVSKALSEQHAMVSLLAFLNTHGIWAGLLIPAFIYFFHFLYPFKKVKYLRSGIAAAAGGCILISRHTLKRIGGIEAYHDAWIDDLALAKLIKRAGFSISLSFTKSVISIRQYCKLSDVWNMVARTAFTQLQYSWFTLFGTVVGMSIQFLVPLFGIIVSIINSFPVIGVLSFLAFIFMSITYTPTLFFYDLSIYRVLALPLAGFLYIAMTLTSAVNYFEGKRDWRGTRKNN
ncbi:MAG TPA: glycosyltransferase [Candidatus Wujingus californicus]|uniref:glycosyltransferase n=2 Tax=Candidatus Wujingus californicus TaxID=3367618 RepID=UPI00402577D3